MKNSRLLPKLPPHRPRSFASEEELRNLILEYFQAWEEKQRPVTIVGMCLFLEISRNTLADYGSGKYDDDFNNFSDTVRQAKDYIENDKWEKGLLGIYNPRMAMLDLNINHGHIEKTHSIVTDKEDNPLPAATANIVLTEDLIKSTLQKIHNEF